MGQHTSFFELVGVQGTLFWPIISHRDRRHLLLYAISQYTSLYMSYYVSIDPGLHFKYTIFWKIVGGAVAAFEMCDRGWDIDDRGGDTPFFYPKTAPKTSKYCCFSTFVAIVATFYPIINYNMTVTVPTGKKLSPPPGQRCVPPPVIRFWRVKFARSGEFLTKPNIF